MICDCCDTEAPDLQVFPTEDDDCVVLCEPCRAMLSEMVEGTAMPGIFPESP